MTNNTNVSAKDVYLDFLPLIYDIVRSIEKEVNDASNNQKLNLREQSDCHEKILELKKKFQKSREMIMKINGISLTKKDQIKKYELLNKQLTLKKELLSRYKHSCPIDTTIKTNSI